MYQCKNLLREFLSECGVKHLESIKKVMSTWLSLCRKSLTLPCQYSESVPVGDRIVMLVNRILIKKRMGSYVKVDTPIPNFEHSCVVRVIIAAMLP